MPFTEALDATQIYENLPSSHHAALGEIHIFEQLDSTNAWALQHGQCADVCLAEQQLAGRGRRGRDWVSPAGVNVYFSLRWCFAEVPQNLPLLSLMTGVAVAQALQDCGLQRHGIKWPNDIYYQGNKLGGILLESIGSLQQVVLGIGLNVNLLAETDVAIDQAWTSWYEIQGTPLSRNTLVAALLNRLLPRLQQFVTQDTASLLAEWQHWDLLRHCEVKVFSADKTYLGIASGVDSQGQLRISLNNGQIKVFSSADVSVRM